MRAAIDEADRLLATFNALLSIAEAEAGAAARRGRAARPRRDRRRGGRALRAGRPRKRALRCRSTAEPGIRIRGDRHLLSQAVANLLDNALKYAAAAISRSGCSGPTGAPCSKSPIAGRAFRKPIARAVFDRFVRLEPSRSTPGNGLGLSLVRAVARRHNGTVALGRQPARPEGPARIPRFRGAALCVIAPPVGYSPPVSLPSSLCRSRSSMRRAVSPSFRAARADRARRCAAPAPSPRRRADRRGSAGNGSIRISHP